MNKIKFYTKLNKTIVKCDRISSMVEILAQNFEDFKKSWESKQLPMQIIVEQKLMDRINHEVAQLASSYYHAKKYNIYFDVNKNPVIEVKVL
jgi:predicted transcriptional regulator